MTTRRFRTVALVLVLLIGGVAPGAMSAAGAQSMSTQTVSDGVDVWTGAPFALAPDASNAERTVTAPHYEIELNNTGQTPVSDQMRTHGVFDADTSVTVEMSDTTLANTTKFAGDEVQLVVAKPSGELTRDAAMSLLNASAPSNAGVSYYVDSAGNISNAGSASASFTPPESGHYMAFFVRPDAGDGFNVTENGDFTRDGDVTVVGATPVFVQEGSTSPSLENDTVEPGSPINVSVSAPYDGEVTHSVVVYNESVLTDQRVTATVENGSLAAVRNASMSTTIAGVNGVVETSAEDTYLSPMSLSLNSLDPVAAAESLTNGSAATTADAVSLDAASVAVANTSADATVSVPTYANWSTGQYRVLHVASNGTESFVTGEKSVTLGSATGGNDDNTGDNNDDNNNDNNAGNGNNEGRTGGNTGLGGGGGGVGGGGSAGPVERSATYDSDSGTFQITITAASGETHVVTFSGNGQNNASESGVQLDSLAVGFANDSEFDMTVSHTRGNTPALSEESFDYLNVSHRASNDDLDSVTFSFTVSAARVGDRDPSQVSLYRFHAGAWTELDTRLVSQGDGSYKYEATSPGLSTFAVAPSNVGASSIEVTSASLGSSTVTAGSAVSVTGTLENTGNVSGTKTVALTVDGDAVATQDVTVPAGETKTAEFSYTPDSAGEYDVAVEDASAGTLTVESESSGGSNELTATTSSGQGDLPVVPIVVMLVVLVLLGVGLYVYREDQL